jgi:hypothetical protein
MTKVADDKGGSRQRWRTMKAADDDGMRDQRRTMRGKEESKR